MNEIMHHGVKGMKWGVRRYQNPDGSYTKIGHKKYDIMSDKDVHLAKGSKTYRITVDSDDKTWDNKKYVSLSKKDNRKWNNYIGKAMKKRGSKVYSNTYQISKDLKVASSMKAGKEFIKLYNNKKTHGQTVKDLNTASSFRDSQRKLDILEAASLNFAAQTKTGKKIVNSLLKKGYSGVVDSHGTNIGNLPVIIFNPDKNMKLIKSKKK